MLQGVTTLRSAALEQYMLQGVVFTLFPGWFSLLKRTNQKKKSYFDVIENIVGNK